tara:strand:- start:19 stop:249 length:231 start_codon:yes stop_codon:yes gene_type:complete
MEDSDSDSDEIFQICPKCHIGYLITNINLFNHILKCDGRKDIITTRFYKKEKLYKLPKSPENKLINGYFKERPSTR